MIKPEQIPKEVVTAFRGAWMDADKTTEAAISAAINAWPGSEQLVLSDGSVMFFIPQVKKDD